MNALVHAEKTFGEFKDYENLMYVTVGEGIGVGIILNGLIFRGHNGGAGEFGHISIGIEIRSTSIGENFDLVGAAAVLLKDIFNFSI